MIPVALPPGWARLATRPSLIGSSPTPKTIGIVAVAACRLFVADYPHFSEMHAEGGQIFHDIADILVLGAARQDLVADHQQCGRDGLFGSGLITCRSTHQGRDQCKTAKDAVAFGPAVARMLGP